MMLKSLTREWSIKSESVLKQCGSQWHFSKTLVIMAFYQLCFIYEVYIDLDSSFSFNMHHESEHLIAINCKVIYTLSDSFLFHEKCRSLININYKIIYHSTVSSLISFNKKQEFSSENSIDIDSDVNRYHDLSFIQQSFSENFNHSYRNTSEFTSQNLIDLKKEIQKEDKWSLESF